MKLKYNREVWAWCFYDWANSAFALTVMAAFFPAFFKGYWSGGVDSAISTARLGFGNASAGIFVAVLSPVLGAIAQAGKVKKNFMLSFAAIGIIMTSALAFIPEGKWFTAIMVFIFARIGFNLANLFYDSFLIDIAEHDKRHFVSSLGYGIGYLGCGILFLFNLIMFIRPDLFGLKTQAGAVRVTFFIAAVWWLVFSIPFMIFVKEKGSVGKSGFFIIISEGLKKMIKTAHDIRRSSGLLTFLVAYWFYIDGVHTVVMMATDYGLSIGIQVNTLMIALLAVQFVAFPSALGFGYLAGYIGAKKSVLFAVGVYVLISLGGAWVIRTGLHFIIFACITGIAQGAVQALSRSMYASFIPKNREAEFFGFYNMIGRFAMVLGPAIVASSNLLLHSAGISGQTASRFGISILSLLFITGGFLLSRLKNL